MFGNLSKLETFRVGGAEIRTTDALAVGLIAWSSYRWWVRKKELAATADSPDRFNKLIPLEDLAQQDMYKLAAIGVALFLLPRLLD